MFILIIFIEIMLVFVTSKRIFIYLFIMNNSDFFSIHFSFKKKKILQKFPLKILLVIIFDFYVFILVHISKISIFLMSNWKIGY